VPDAALFAETPALFERLEQAFKNAKKSIYDELDTLLTELEHRQLIADAALEAAGDNGDEVLEAVSSAIGWVLEGDHRMLTDLEMAVEDAFVGRYQRDGGLTTTP
jgi:hypothetical protein